jgi:peptidoglycan/xylan/chitin deacetylase (PgdA/CDA1 family)
MYHSISQTERSTEPGFKSLCVPPSLFEAQVDYLYRSEYTLLNVTQLLRALVGQDQLPERPVVLTFDDGYADFYNHALPILSHYRLTATLYIATGFVERTSLWLRFKGETGHPMLTWSQIAEISASGIECGAHTHSHPKLDRLPLAIAGDEIQRSKDLLEHYLGQEVTSFAYPYGCYTSDVRRLVKEAGFTSACAVHNAMCSDKADLFTLDRLAVTPNMDIPAFHALLTQENASLLRSMCMPVKRMLRYCMASVRCYYAAWR